MSIKLLTLPEAAAHIVAQTGMSDITERWIKRQIEEGKLGATVVANKRRVRQDHLDKIIAGWVKAAA